LGKRGPPKSPQGGLWCGFGCRLEVRRKKFDRLFLVRQKAIAQGNAQGKYSVIPFLLLVASPPTKEINNGEYTRLYTWVKGLSMKTAITIDIDWAPDEVLGHTLELISKSGVPCTLFATHSTGLLNELDKNQFEIGVHPNFNPSLNGKKEKPEVIVERLRQLFPQARGVRSHSSLVSNVLIDLFAEMGFEYESHVCLPYSRNLEVLPLWNELLRIPFNWEDYLHFSFGKSFKSMGLPSGAELNIVNFHPVHIFLNTESRERYEGAKAFYQDPKHLSGFRNLGKGTATLFQELLAKDFEFVKLEDLVDEYRKTNL
jgi:hypothetical protein